MNIDLPITIYPQPDDTTCGPTCLHAVYQYYGEKDSLEAVINTTHTLEDGGTLAVFLANAALRRGYRAVMYTYNLEVFDPSWFAPGVDLSDRLRQQAAIKQNPRLQHATEGYLEFLELGGQLRFSDLNRGLLRGILRRRLPILTGLSATYLYRSARVYGVDEDFDDLRGEPSGHFVILAGYHSEDRSVLIADPYLPNPVADGHFYAVNIDRVICSIMLGVLTHDANLLIIQPAGASQPV
ncbi:MAG: hypothetical protein WD750_10875 [Gammaproteobacteria bacterium]